jgi:VWFA-related protein
MRHASSLLAICLAAQAPAPAAQTPKPPVFPSSVELVALDVNVVDENGRPVRDLGPEDFEVKVGGQPRRVASAEFIAQSGAAEETATRAKASFYSSNEGLVQGRLLLLAVDEGNISAGGGQHAARAAEGLLDRLGAADRVALLSVPGPQPREDFTTDHAKVRAALRNVVGRARLQGRRLSLSESLLFVNNEDAERWRQVVARVCRAGDAGCPEELENEAREVWAEYQAVAARSLGVLRASFEALKSVEGTKVVILVTQGLGLPGAGTRAGTTPELQALAAAARSARASFFVVLIDPGPGTADMEGQISPMQLMEDHELHARALDYVADAAGGAVLRGTPENSFERIAREIAGHYQLGFEPEGKDRDGKEHDVSVKVRRPKLIVRVGREATIPKAGAQRDERALLVALLKSPVPAAELPIRTATWTLKDPGSGKVRILVETEAAGQPTPASASVAYLLLDAKGKPAGTGMQPMLERGEPAKPRGTLLLVEPGQFTLRVAARDRQGRMGSVERSVPAVLASAEGIELSDLLLGPAPEDGQSFRPSLDPMLKLPAGSLGIYFELYAKEASRLDPVAVWFDVIRADGTTLVKTLRGQLGTTSHEGRRAAQAVVPAAGLQPSDYLLRANVASGDKPLATVARPFRVLGE